MHKVGAGINISVRFLTMPHHDLQLADLYRYIEWLFFKHSNSGQIIMPP
jgi:hypothetical protein